LWLAFPQVEVTTKEIPKRELRARQGCGKVCQGRIAVVTTKEIPKRELRDRIAITAKAGDVLVQLQQKKSQKGN
jgi:hypothetical protein